MGFWSVEVINVLLGTTGSGTSWHTTSGHTWHTLVWWTTSLLVDSHHNWVEFSLEFLLFALNSITISLWVALKPLETFLGNGSDSGLLLFGEDTLELLFVKSVLHLEAVVLDSLFGESTLIVGNGNLLRFSSSLILGGNVKDTIGINIEGDLNLRNTSWGWWDTFKVEFTELMVILGHFSLTFENLDHDTGLVVSISGEDLGFLGWDSGVSLDEASHDTASGLNTHGEWGDIKKKELGSLLVTLSGKDGSLDGSTVSNSLIGVDGLVENLTIEEIGKHLLDLWDSSGSTDKDDLVNLVL